MTRWFSRRMARRRIRLLGLLAFRDAARYLPGWLENVPPHVDGFIAVDDGSTDESADLVRSHPSLLSLVRLPVRDPHVWDDGRNHRIAIEAALRHRPDWLIAVDADERLEVDFRRRAEEHIGAEGRRARAFSVQLRELWDRPDQYRVDGIWGQKRSARLFTPSPSGAYDDRVLHGHWAPLDTMTDGGFPEADLILYHLHMVRAEDRAARRARYEMLDPERRWQSMGYAYLTDESGLRLEALPNGRGYVPLGR